MTAGNNIAILELSKQHTTDTQMMLRNQNTDFRIKFSINIPCNVMKWELFPTRSVRAYREVKSMRSCMTASMVTEKAALL